MPDADDALALYDAILGALRAHRQPGLGAFLSALQTIDRDAERRPRRPPLIHPSMAHLEPALSDVEDPRVVAGARDLDWSPVFEGGGIEPRLAEGLLAAQLAGSYGRFAAEGVAAGLFLIAPDVTYPLHTHEAAEVYLCFSGRLRLQHGVTGRPFDLTAGELSVTPPHRLHALETGEEPVLLGYIWSGNVTAPMWWWEQTSAGGWHRTSWRREPGAPWRPVSDETVTPEIMAEAHN